MKLSAKVEYAFKAVLELSIHYHEKRPVQLKEIYQSQRVPKKYLVQILLRLKDAGLVRSSRGVAGGYHLAKAPSKITLAGVFGAVDSQLLEQNQPQKMRQDSDQLIHQIWGSIHRHIEAELKINYDDLVARLKGVALNYQI
ncbi:MAG: Rrf2 family transcriptional regulator [Candidatus Omnitrophica bacterium]|nr:Rrf2 family transcriptional regulator [Candidatus Omnitrophota bacterium]MDD5671128.1 Rrf2 family transcriptional regulator [Candidatus Omnitrophota bacterium]